jgi:hypothetical protein
MPHFHSLRSFSAQSHNADNLTFPRRSSDTLIFSIANGRQCASSTAIRSQFLNPQVDLVDVPFRSGSPFDGIIAYLTRKHSGNLHDLGIVNATLSSVYANCGGRGALTADSQLSHTNDVPNSWLCYHFKELFIDMTHYSIRSRLDGTYHHLQTWRIERPINGTEWVKLDNQNGRRDLVGQSNSYTFPTQ